MTEAPAENAMFSFAVRDISAKKPAIEIIVKCVYIPYVGSVDIPNNSCQLRVDLDLEWIATAADRQSFEEAPDDFRPGFVPQLVFQNAKEVETLEVPGADGNPFKITPAGYNFVRLKVVGTFIQQYELQSFPVDVQQLTISISVSFLTAKELLLVPPPPNADGTPFTFVYVIGRYSALPDWRFKRVLCDFVVQDAFSHLVVIVQIQRIPNAILLKGFLPALLYAYFGFFNISVNPDALSDRLGVIITLLLTFTALQQNVASYLPLVPYNTLYDKYVWACFTALFSLGMLAFVMGTYSRLVPLVIEDSEQKAVFEMADRVAHLVVLAVMTGVQLFFVFKYRSCKNAELRKTTMPFKELVALEERENAKSGSSHVILMQATDSLSSSAPPM